MKMALKSLPVNLESSYASELKRIGKGGKDTKELALRVMSWIFHAARPLQMEELCEALAVREEDSDLDEETLIHPDVIIEVCQSLVLYDERTSTVRLTHYSLYEFLRDGCREDLLSFVDLAKICIAYLGFKVFSNPCQDIMALEERIQKYKFSSYAAQFWAVHAKGDAEKSRDIRIAIYRAFGSAGVADSVFQITTQAHGVSRSFQVPQATSRFSLLHVVVMNGLSTICQILLEGTLNVR